MPRPPHSSPLFPYTTLFRSIFLDLNDPKTWAELSDKAEEQNLLNSARFVPLRLKQGDDVSCLNLYKPQEPRLDRKSTRLNSSHLVSSYAVFCLKKKKQ